MVTASRGAFISQPPLREDQVAKTIDHRVPARRYSSGGVELLDDGGTRQHGTGIEAVTFVKRRGRRSCAVETDSALAFAGVRGGAPRRRRLLARLEFRHRDAQAQPIAHELHRPVLGAVTVNMGMALIETDARASE